MTQTLAHLNIDAATLALFRVPLRRSVERLEESIMYTRKRLADDEQSLAAVQNTLNLDDAGLTAHVEGVKSARSLAELIIAMGGIDNIKHILSPSSVDMGTNRCFDDGVSGLSLIFNDRALVRTKDGVTYLSRLDIRAESDGTFFFGPSRPAFYSIPEAVAHIETMFDVSFNGGAPRVPTVTATEVVLPPELQRYEKAIREAISQALPVKDGVTVCVRTKKPRAPKPKTPTEGNK